MIGKSLKSILAVALIAGGAAFSTTSTANAGGGYGVYIGGGHGGVYFGSGHYGPRYGVRGHRRHGHCGPRKAVNKAWRMGVNRPYVQRVNGNKIVVGGYKYGHRAKVVFKRSSPHCRVIRTRGLR